jgi:glycosyltransferase involved in cell wall biosynthesis
VYKRQLPDSVSTDAIPLTKSQERFRSYWGIDPARIRAVGKIANEWSADATVVIGLNVLPYLAEVKSGKRIWYAGDEWVSHHLSQLKFLRPSTWRELKPAVIKGWYERAYRSIIDRVWMVSESDAMSWRRVTGCDNADVLVNGIDTAYYAPGTAALIPKTCVFWGRLDFGPNIQALDWFCSNAWSRIRSSVGDAKFTIIGYRPGEEIRRIARENQGIDLIPDLDDLRNTVHVQSLVVLPFISGGGIKNKLLEAASMAKAVVATPRVIQGLQPDGCICVTSTAGQMARAIQELWSAPTRISQMGTAARAWVEQKHSWESTALLAEESLIRSIRSGVSA